ncbi:amino acid ABC transporter permease [Desulfotalea psychrophila]|uniref:Probable amino acid ABC transporter, permease protein n=1 Tax=Desulfotalea psychrophila (strain LSv54 / DSM 12343) TaxID=177439 RepID=Q6ANA9_DESPS|nr:amino acid ABC transporter permease [Desulfotalea psychrophila]CAG36165.1 probable amino acid ABC transporter, permease protein [Desulfotalea psychrophila LSv54]
MSQQWIPKSAQPCPVTEKGPLGWMYKNLFSSPFNTVLTLLGVSLLFWLITPLVRWAIIDATWVGTSRDACTVLGGCDPGACWVFIKVRFQLFMYGFYPEVERWRINFAFVLIAFAALPHLIPDFFAKSWRQYLRVALALALIAAFFGLQPFLVAAPFFLAPFLLARFSLKERVVQGRHPILVGLAASILVCLAVSLSVRAIWGDGGAWALGLSAALLVYPLFALKQLSETVWRWNLLCVVYPLIAYFLFVGDAFGLVLVETHFWGGLFLTLVVAGTGMATAMPIGILLALGRCSKMIVIRTLCIGFIELVRGVPLISVLFMASVMFPLFLPENMSFDKLLRALIGVAFFYAAYIAEVIRGGLQAIPKGQYEAAEALGWTYWKKMSVIILPQTLRMVIPGLANNFLSLLKDTTLVAVIGLLDLLGVAKAALADAAWLGFTKEAYVFAGLVFWIFCFAISRYSNFLEKKYHTNYR